MFNAVTKKKESDLLFQPIEKQFKNEAAEIMEKVMKEQGIVLPPGYCKRFDKAYMQIGAMYHQHVVELSI